jgi:predicted signal transduction protein with EAL and GGDEF domain
LIVRYRVTPLAGASARSSNAKPRPIAVERQPDAVNLSPLQFKDQIDRSFVGGLARGDGNRAIVRAILAMADSVNIEVVAEGVETLEQASALKAMNCMLWQGYLVSRPVPAPDISALVRRDWSHIADPAVPG